jgi:Tol biopolymer transport system component
MEKSNSLRVFVALAALASAVLVAVLVGTGRAEAAFPGENGKIVFASNPTGINNPEGDDEIFTMNPDGTGLQQLTQNFSSDAEPAFSPDGTKITFESIRDSCGGFFAFSCAKIYTMDADGQNQVRRSNNDAFDVSPDWQPR